MDHLELASRAGRARAKKLSKKRRREIAQMGGLARAKKRRGKKGRNGKSS